MITISGIAQSVSGVGQQQPVQGATVAAYASSDDTTALATTTTDAQGQFSLTVDTGGAPLAGYLKATANSYADSYIYPPAAIAADTTDVAVLLVTPTTYNSLYTFTQVSQQQGTGVVALVVMDTAQAPVAGATATSTPAATYKYNNAQGFPSSSAMSTAADGAAYVLNAPAGAITVGAAKQNATFASHDVKAWAGALTTTLVLQQ
jgi:hypothetical protein